MIKRITKIGRSPGLMLDNTLMALARVKVGDQVSISVNKSGSIVLTPVRPVITSEKATVTAKRLIKKNTELFHRLA